MSREYSRKDRSRGRRRSRSRSHRGRSPSCAPKYIREIVNSFRETIDTISRTSRQSEPLRGTVSHDARNSIPTFDPSDAHQTIETWLEKIEDLKRMYRWDDVTASTFMTARLQGLARKWYEALPSVAMTWEEWKVKITAAFKDRTELPARLAKMMGRVKSHDEDMAAYFYDKAALVTACGFRGRDAVQCIAHGIYDNAIKAAIRLSDFTNTDDLRAFLAKYDTPSNSAENKNGAALAENKNRGFRRNIRSRPDREERRNDRKREKPGEKTSGCFVCGQTGHYARDCPERKETRHGVTTERSQKKHAVHSIGSATTKLDTRFFEISANGQPLRAYVDLGSEVVTLRKSEADRLKLQVQPTTGVLRGYGGAMIHPHGTTTMTLKVDLAEAEVEVHVVPDHLQEVPMIIGQPFTDQPTVVVVQRQGNLRLFDGGSCNLPEVEQLPPRKLTLWAKEATVIPPGQGANIEVTVKNNKYMGDIFIEMSLRNKENAEHCIPRCVINTKTGLLPVCNLSDYPLEIKADQIVARAEVIREATVREVNVLSVKRDKSRELPVEQIKICDDIPLTQRKKIIDLLNRYRDCFALDMSELGRTHIAEIDIELTSSTPVFYRPYRLSYAEREKVKELVAELKDNKIIRDSNSPFASPILLVKKKTGEIRMCVDYRALNKITKKDRFPLPIIEDQINNLQGAIRYTSLDAASCYYQIPVAKNAIEKTAFVTPDGQYEFLCQPFGLVNAPAVCQRMATKIIAPLKGKMNIQAYIDDYIIASKDIESGMHELESFLRRLREVGLTLRLDKCTFLMRTIDFLGYEISEAGVRPGTHKIQAVAEFKRPSNVHETRQFVGLASYFRKFIKNFALIARPLTNLTRKEAAWQWGDVEEGAFCELKDLLTSRPVLALYDPKAETELHTDASKWGLAGILLQRQIDKLLKPVAFFSRQTTKEEQRYHSYELETLAIISSLHRFRVFVLGIHFKILSDCSALRATFLKRDLSPRIGRWWIQLQEYDCTIEYRPGVRMAHVDALSRNAIVDTRNAEEIRDVGIYRIEHDDLLLLAQLQDEGLKFINEVLSRDAKDKNERRIHEEYARKNGRIYRKTETGLKWAVPRAMRRRVTAYCHDEIGHVGLDKTLTKIQTDYWFAGMKRYVRRYLSACVPCFFNKEPAGKKPGFLNPIEKIPEPMHTLHVDHLGPFVRSTAKNSYLIVAVDAFTKFVFLKAIANTKTILAVRFIDEIASVFGYPQRIISDRGTAFTSKKFTEYCQALNIKHVLTAVATPRANGQVERYNRTILDGITTTLTDETTWDRAVDRVKWGLNNTINKATGKSPSELLLGYRPRHKAEAALLNEVGLPSRDADRGETRKRAAGVIKERQNEAKRRYDLRRAKPKVFKRGDAVGIRKVVPSNDGKSKKLLQKYYGPYEVKEVLENDRYVVGDIAGLQHKQKPYDGIFPGEKLKLWELAVSSESSDESEGASGDERAGKVHIKLTKV